MLGVIVRGLGRLARRGHIRLRQHNHITSSLNTIHKLLALIIPKTFLNFAEKIRIHFAVNRILHGCSSFLKTDKRNTTISKIKTKLYDRNIKDIADTKRRYQKWSIRGTPETNIKQ